MQSKEYKFLDTVFTTQKNVLKINHAYIPLKKYLAQASSMYLEGMDLSRYKFHTDKYQKLKFKDDKDNSDLKIAQELKDTVLIERISKAIENNKSEFEKLDTDFREDKEAMNQYVQLLNANQFAEENLLTSYELIKGFLDTYLIGDLTKLDYENEAITEFVNTVMSDFFLSKKNQITE